LRPAPATEGADEQAATALVLEAIDPRQAAEAWGRYLALAGDRAPFAEHARQRASSLRKSKGDMPQGGAAR
jgi:hypothetical protein